MTISAPSSLGYVTGQPGTERQRGTEMSFANCLKKENIYTFGDTFTPMALCRLETHIYNATPLNKRGHLKTFSGKEVRIVVVESGRYDRGLMAGVYKSNK